MPRHSNSDLYIQHSHNLDATMLLGKRMVLPSEEKMKPILFGCELECSTDYSVAQIMDAQEIPFMVCKSDGTITGIKNNRYELVTAPMSIKAHETYWANWFSVLDIEKFDTSIDTNNGFHIHIDRSRFTEDHLKAFVWLFMNPLNHYFFKIMAERDDNSIKRWCRFMETDSSSSLIYLYKHCVSKTRALDKYAAINLRKSATVEVRLFRGVVSYASILKNLELVEAAYRFTEEYTDTAFFSVTLKNFLEFINKSPPNQWMGLKAFLKTFDLSVVFNQEEVEKFLLTIQSYSNVQSVYTELLKRPELMKNIVLVQKLNQKFGKKSFYFNKEQGVIQLIPVKKGRIHHLDHILIQKKLQKVTNKELQSALSCKTDIPFTPEDILFPDSSDSIS